MMRKYYVPFLMIAFHLVTNLTIFGQTTTVTLSTVGSGTWKPPLGCDSFYVEMWGGGGPGTFPWGGSGGNFARSITYKVDAITRDSGYNYNVGKAGAWGGVSGGPFNGGDSYFKDCYARGGTWGGAARLIQVKDSGENKDGYMGGQGGQTLEDCWYNNDWYAGGGGGSAFKDLDGLRGRDGSGCSHGAGGGGTGGGGAGPDGVGNAPGGGGGSGENRAAGARGEIRIYYYCTYSSGKIGNEHTVPFPRELNGDLITNVESPGGGSGYTFSWQDSIAGGVWTTIPDANQINLTFPEISTTTYYRRLINGCGTNKISNVVKIKVFNIDNADNTIPSKNGKISGYVRSVNGGGVAGIRMILKKNIPLKGSPQSHEYYDTTDSKGRYTFTDIFYGDKDNQDPVKVFFTVYPVKANHIFSDTSLTDPNMFLSSTEYSRTDPDVPDIIDSTVYDITGKVFQQCVGCLDNTNTPDTIQSGGEDVNIGSDAFFSIVTTDSMGNFMGTINNAGPYTFTPSYPVTGNVKHQFNPKSRNVPVYDDVSDVIFEDTTTHTISGKLTAGAGDYIGQAVLEFSDTLITASGTKIPTFRKRVSTDSITGDFFIRLPARKNYGLKIVSFKSSVLVGDPKYISQDDFLDFFNNLAPKDPGYKNLTTFDIDSSDIVRDIVYHRKPELEVTGLTDTCGNIGVVYYQNVPKYFKVNIWEGPKVLGYKVVTSDPAPFAETSQKATLDSGSTVLTLSAANNKILKGQYVTGEGIAPNTAVTAVAGTSLTISKPASISGTSTVSFGDVINQSASFTAGSQAVTLSANNASILPGAVVTGAGIAAGTTVAAYDPSGTSLTLSAITLSAGIGVGLIFGNLIDIKESSLTIGDSIHIYTDVLDQTGDPELDPDNFFLRTMFGSIDTFLIPGVPKIAPPNYGKIFTVKYKDRYGRAAAEIKKPGVVTGVQSPPNTFTTVAPEMPQVVIHRPPGDLSSSFWQSGAVFETSTRFSTYKEKGINISNTATHGVKKNLGIGVATELSIEFGKTKDFTISVGKKTNQEWTETMKTNTKFSTATEGSLYSEGKNEGDVFIGAATNYIYGVANEVKFNNNCELEKNDVLVIAPQGFATTFTYSEYYITHTLIPTLVYIGTHAADDSTKDRYLEQVDVWKQVLANNDKEKADAEFVVNRSFDGGAGPIEETFTSESSYSQSIDFKLSIDKSTAQKIGAKFDAKGNSTKVKVFSKKEYGLGFGTTTTKSTTTGYVLDDKNPGDYYSVDIKKDGVYGTPVFALVAGTSSCPSEPIAQSRDFPYLSIDSTSLNNLPVTGESFFKLRLQNLSQSREDRTYNLLLNSATSNGLTIKSSTGVLGSAGSVTSYPVPYGSTLDVVISVQKFNPADPTLSYPGVEFHLVDGCLNLEGGGGLPTIQGAWNDSYKAIDINFVSTCGGISLVAPTKNWVVASADNNILPITFNKYQKGNIDTVYLEYAKVGTNSWKTGFKLSNSQITDPTTTTHNWDVSDISTFSLTDSVLVNYKIRLKLRCLGGSIIYSTEVQGIIDIEPPFLTGKPEPSDNVFVLGDQISFTYNEDIKDEDLNNKIELVLLSGNTLLPVTASVLENKLTIVPPNNIFSFVGDSCRVVVHNVFDLYGNEQIQSDTFYFTIGTAPIVLGSVPVKVYVVTPSMPENSSGAMEIHFKLPDNYTNSSLVKVNYNVSGTALYSTDYTVTSDILSRVVSGVPQPISIYSLHNSSHGYIYIDVNKKKAILKIYPSSDTLNEGDETIKINLISGAGYILADSTTATATVTDAVSIVSDGPLVLCSDGTVKLSASPAGNSLQFDGENDYLKINNNLGNFGTGDFTIEMNIKTTSFNSDIISKRGLCNLDNFINLKVYNNRARFEIAENAGGANIASLTSSSVINNNAWHHIAVTRLSGTITLYVDGVVERTAFSNANINNTYPFVLGTSVCVPFLTDNLSGNIDEVRMWNKARTAAQILAGRNTELQGNSAGLAAYYKFNEQTGNTTADASLNENTGTLMNGAVRVVSTAPVQYATYFWTPGGATTPSIQAGTGSYTVQVIDLNGQLIKSAPVQVTISASATVNAGSSLLNICPGIASIALGGSFIGGTGAVWSDSTAGGVFTSNLGSTPNMTMYTPAANANGIINLKLTSIGGCSALAYKQLFINGKSTWLGTSSDWSLGSNWSNGLAPISCTKVTIPNGLPFMPTITGVSNICNELILQKGANVNVGEGAKLLITGRN